MQMRFIVRLKGLVERAPTISTLMQATSSHPAAKRAFDVVAASITLLALSPLILAVSLAVVVTDGMPVVYRQRRLGRHGAPFVIYKFRTMRRPSDDEIELLTDDERVTRLGRWLRRTSLDELPQLWNVVRGDMSLVGPRPLLDVHRDLATEAQRRRYLMRPGVTGAAQVSGRRALTFSQRFDLDALYVDSWTLRGDLKIIALTAKSFVAKDRNTENETFESVDDIGLRKVIQNG